jgi:hypothetical protein
MDAPKGLPTRIGVRVDQAPSAGRHLWLVGILYIQPHALYFAVGRLPSAVGDAPPIVFHRRSVSTPRGTIRGTVIVSADSYADDQLEQNRQGNLRSDSSLYSDLQRVALPEGAYEISQRIETVQT